MVKAMDSPKKIMVPVDLSKRSERALEYAAQLAARLDAELVLTTNVDYAERAALKEYAEIEGLSIADAAEASLQALAAQYAPDLPTSVIVRFHNSAADGILHAAEDAHVDAIVMGSHGRTGMSRWMLGSVAEKVVRTAEVPVTVLPVRGL